MRTHPPTFGLLAPLALLAACGSGSGSHETGKDGGGPDVTVDAPPDQAAHEASTKDAPADGPGAPPPLDGPATLYSQLPGTLCFQGDGKTTLVPGGRDAPPLTWLSLPAGFCAHYFAHVQTTRQLRQAPGGEIFAASPSTYTAGGAPAGLGGIVVLYDDNGDGYADGDTLPHTDGSPQSLSTFTNVASVQGLLFAPGFFYFQNGTQIMKVAYASGQRSLMATPSVAVDISAANGRYVSVDHWPKTLDIADDGTIYVGNGGDQSQACNPSVFPRPFLGGIVKIDGTPGGNPVAQGFRNPIALRCQKGHDLCFSVELGLDGSADSGGREKVVPIRQGDDWGFPCCATTNVPYADVGDPNCSQVASEEVSLVIGDTPFGLDFETGLWPAPYTNNVLVALHGEVGSLIGERVIAVPVQANGMPMTSSDLGSMTVPQFAGGWDGTNGAHGRPSSITFAADGRAYIGNDNSGDIFWVAPATLPIK